MHNKMNAIKPEIENKINLLVQNLRTSTPEPYLKANLAIAFASMAYEQAVDKMVRKYGLSHKRFLMLHVLMENGGSMPMPELAQKMFVSRQAVALSMNSFEKRGLVVMNGSDDRRIKRITITEKGLDLVTQISLSEYRLHVHNIIMSVINEREARLLTDMMDSLAKELMPII